MYQSIPSAGIPPGKPPGNFFEVVRNPALGQIFLQKHCPQDKKTPTPGSILKDLVSFSCWSVSKFWNFAEIKPLKELEG